ncbi:MAG TPA: prepilin-type N-terminal cleavage/methylation domain-containing protein, partial [Chthoniobacteraceae bacterium]
MLQKLNKNRGGFTLVEIMIVVAIIALLAAIAVPNFLRARKRSQATRILEDLRMIDSAIDQYAIENNKKEGDSVSSDAVKGYLKKGSALY